MIFATGIVDYAYSVFVYLRSKIVLACAPDALYDAYNDFAYNRQKNFRAGSDGFIKISFPWEKQAISRYFPPPPGTVLVGASGGGREALALARQGYRVVAFDPARVLVASLANIGSAFPIETFLGGYEDLPLVNSLSQPPITMDLRARAPFAAAVIGYGSISHLRSDELCV